MLSNSIKINIAIFSSDKFLCSFVKKYTTNTKVDIYSDLYGVINYNEYCIFILDSIDKVGIEYLINNINTSFALIINISTFKLNDIVNIKTPFKVNILKDHIDTYINYIKKYCIINDIFKLNINKNILLIDNKNIQLTEKECLLIKILYNKEKIYKDDLLKIVCGYDNGRAIETLIYNIRFKLKNNGIENFITCQNGYYKLNLL